MVETRRQADRRMSAGRRRTIRVGCSGWSYGHWRGILYPESGATDRWLEIYAESFDTVEVNATFYRLPERKTVARWAQATPPGFCFAVKASRYLTHVKRLRDLASGVALLTERIEPLASAGKLGPVLWQLPANFHRDVERLGDALGQLPPGRNALEPRHPSWFAEEVYELLAERDVALVAADRLGSSGPIGLGASSWAYARLHHGKGRNGRYTEGQLREWASQIRAYPGDVYAYFNNDWEGFAVENARALCSLVAEDSRTRRRGTRRA